MFIGLFLLCSVVDKWLEKYGYNRRQDIQQGYSLVFVDIRWVDGSGFVNRDISPEYQFINQLSDAFLYQLVEAPTRENNILDLVLSNNPELVDTIFVENTEGLPSDHKSISFNLFRLAKVINSPSRYVYDFKNADFRSLRAYLSLDTNDIPEGTMDGCFEVMEERVS